MEWPRFVIPARKGAVPNLTPTQARDILLPEERIISVSVFDASEYVSACKGSSRSLAQFCGLEDFSVALVNRSSFIGLHASAPSTENGIAGDHEKGRIGVTLEKMKEVVAAIQPSLVLGLSESVPLCEGWTRKRRTAHTRTEKWSAALNKHGISNEGCSLLQPFAVAAADSNAAAAGGYYIDCMPRNENTMEFAWNLKESLHLGGAIASSSYVYAYSMPLMIAAMDANCHFVESPLPWLLAEKGIAITVALDDSRATSGSFPPLDAEIDLNDDMHKLDILPLCPDCDCYTCRRHNRAYIHHLLTVQEMNSTILLAIHNLARVVHIFRRCRQLPAEERGKFLRHLIDQY